MTTQPKILLVEDEENLLEGIKLNLELENYQVITAVTGSAAIEKVDDQKFDLIILDVMLPEISGFDICKHIRLSDEITPILFLTARGDSTDRINGLKIGGDDYLTKPFNLEEFLLRVEKLLKRSQVNNTKSISTFELNQKQIDFDNYQILSNTGDVIFLTKKETALLQFLVAKKNQVVSREEILNEIWGYEVYPSTRTIDNFITTFRKYFESNPKTPGLFQSVRGVGYKLNVIN